MSVREEDRGEGKLAVLVDAKKLAIYTIQITSNEKVFDPQYKSKLTDDIVEHAKSIFIYASEANDTRVKKNGDNWDERNKLQKEAIEYCRKLMMEIDLAKSLFHLRAKRVRHWYEWAKRVKSRLVAWNESDTDRYGKL